MGSFVQNDADQDKELCINRHIGLAVMIFQMISGQLEVMVFQGICYDYSNNK